ncbi:hypothetical protein K474DRAFT_1676695 [Panus rudis PR-1116 ss-1]|nr:hypothetical protein K474DRAFT_1676695 [Panus rudis PR-1116 ss-1]
MSLSTDDQLQQTFIFYKLPQGKHELLYVTLTASYPNTPPPRSGTNPLNSASILGSSVIDASKPLTHGCTFLVFEESVLGVSPHHIDCPILNMHMYSSHLLLAITTSKTKVKNRRGCSGTEGKTTGSGPYGLNVNTIIAPGHWQAVEMESGNHPELKSNETESALNIPMTRSDTGQSLIYPARAKG